MLLDGPMNGVAFLAYVEQVLVPTLVPGDQSSWTTCLQAGKSTDTIESYFDSMTRLKSYRLLVD